MLKHLRGKELVKESEISKSASRRTVAYSHVNQMWIKQYQYTISYGIMFVK